MTMHQIIANPIVWKPYVYSLVLLLRPWPPAPLPLLLWPGDRVGPAATAVATADQGEGHLAVLHRARLT